MFRGDRRRLGEAVVHKGPGLPRRAGAGKWLVVHQRPARPAGVRTFSVRYLQLDAAAVISLGAYRGLLILNLAEVPFFVAVPVDLGPAANQRARLLPLRWKRRRRWADPSDSGLAKPPRRLKIIFARRILAQPPQARAVFLGGKAVAAEGFWRFPEGRVG